MEHAHIKADYVYALCDTGSSTRDPIPRESSLSVQHRQQLVIVVVVVGLLRGMVRH